MEILVNPDLIHLKYSYLDSNNRLINLTEDDRKTKNQTLKKVKRHVLKRR